MFVAGTHKPMPTRRNNNNYNHRSSPTSTPVMDHLISMTGHVLVAISAIANKSSLTHSRWLLEPCLVGYT